MKGKNVFFLLQFWTADYSVHITMSYAKKEEVIVLDSDDGEFF